MNLIIFILAVIGMTQIITWGKIFNKLRPKWSFFKCSQCIGFHCGWALFLIFWFSGIKLFSNLYSGMFVFGCLSSFVSYFFDSLVGDFGFRVEKK